MNPFVANAKLQMSFRNLYSRSRDHRSDSAIAIACAMTALLVINIWSIFLIVVLVTRTSLIGKHYLAPGPYVLTLALLFLLELALVKIVQEKVVNEPMFSKQVAATSPAVSIWYSGISVGAPYCFKPGHDADHVIGITQKLPLAGVNIGS